MESFTYRSRVTTSAKDLFTWHTRAGAFERLTPPWEDVAVLEKTDGLEDGSRVVIRTKIGLVPMTWLIEHRDYTEEKQFCDIQIKGPFKHWEHTHTFVPDGPNACFLEDNVKFLLPMGILGEVFGNELVIRRLETLFEYRHGTLINDIKMHKKYGVKPMKVLITGSTGLIGSSLIPFLSTGGHSITCLKRDKSKIGENDLYWNSEKREIDTSKLQGFDAVVHLSGENVAGRWTDEKKAKIEDSRVKSTRLLSNTLSKLKKKPAVLVCASAIGFYGDRDDEILTEDSQAGKGFLADVSKKWEAATAVASKAGIRVVNLRLGVVLSPRGGALEKMLLPFRVGLGGKVGSGRQWMSWVSIHDVIGATYHAINNDSLEGPVNAVSPKPVTNLEFTNVLGNVLKRPTFFTVPSLLLRALFGEMADETLLSSTRVMPSKLLSSGYEFQFTDLEASLRNLLGKPKV
ncbi:MAG: TIGR01777 family oxidoreductase [Thermodesulfobacteriota bacterium]